MYLQNCRVCFKKCVRNQIPLSDTLGNNISALEAYKECTQIEAHANDELPQILCQSCGKELNRFYKFICRAKETNQRLRNTSESFDNDDELEMPHYVQDSFLKVEEIKCLKDPLEESADESNDSKNNFNEFADECTGNYSSDDGEEDNKTLKSIIENGMTKSSNSEFKTETKMLENGGNSDVDEFEYENHSIAAEFTKSVQSEIFPQGQYRCKICDKIYFTSIGLKSHLEYHMPKSNAASALHNRKNKTKKVLKVNNSFDVPTMSNIDNAEKLSNILDGNNEALSQTNKPKEKLQKSKKLFPCIICNKLMISASKLRYHMVMHTGEKNYLCTVCPKAYSTIYALKHHIRTHTGERPYECKFCGERFLRPTTLKSHLRRHTGERPYGCNICGKRFIQHSSMTTHVRLNHMEKTIPCPHCHKKYARQTDLNTHLLSHTGDKPFSCHLCQRRFVRQANLNKHMNQLHMEKSNLFKNSKKSNNKSVNEQKSNNQTKLLYSKTIDTSAPVSVIDNCVKSDTGQQNRVNNLISPTINNTMQTEMGNNNVQQPNFLVSTNTDCNVLAFNKPTSTGLVPL